MGYGAGRALPESKLINVERALLPPLAAGKLRETEAVDAPFDSAEAVPAYDMAGPEGRPEGPRPPALNELLLPLFPLP